MCKFGYGIGSIMGFDYANIFVCPCNVVSPDIHEHFLKNKNKHRSFCD